MKKYNLNSFVKIVECGYAPHKGYTGHIISVRVDGGYNVLLWNHEKCAAKKVELITEAYKRRKHKKESFLEVFVNNLYWFLVIRGFI